MRTSITSCILMLLISISSGAQVRQAAGKINVNTAPGGIVGEIKEEPLPVKGSQYLFDAWETGNLKLKSGQTLNSVLINYDLSRNRFEIIKDQEKRIFKAGTVYSYQRKHQDQQIVRFINSDGFLLDQLPLTGFYKILVGANRSGLGLFSKTELKLKKSYYVPALDVGEKADSYTKTETTYLVSGINVHRLPKKENAFWEFFKEPSVMESWAKDEKLKWKRREDLVKILDHYNSSISD